MSPDEITDDPLPRDAERVVLRRLDPTDLKAFQAYRRDREVSRYQGWEALPDKETLDFIAEMRSVGLFEAGAWCQIGIARREDNVLIGDIGMHLSDDGSRVYLGISLDRGHQGRGLAIEALRAAIHLAFELTDADRVVGITDARNIRSIRLLERVGMRHADTRKGPFKGEICTEHIYELARPDGA